MTDATDGTEGTDNAGPAGHLSTETIADLQEGLLEHEPAQRAQVHLLTCPVCAAEELALKDVPRLLVASDEGCLAPALLEVVEVTHRDPGGMSGGGTLQDELGHGVLLDG